MSNGWPEIGEYNFKVTEWKHEVTEGEKKAPYVFCLCQVVEGQYVGEEAGYKVFLLRKDGTPNEIARETLRVMGWNGKDFENMPGLGSTVFPGIMTKRVFQGRDGNPREIVELSGIKGVNVGMKRGAALAPSEVRNLAKLFGASGGGGVEDDVPV